MTLQQAMQWAEKNCTAETVVRLRSRAVVATLADEVRELLAQNAQLREALEAECQEREKWAQICDGFDAVNPHIGQAAEVARRLFRCPC